MFRIALCDDNRFDIQTASAMLRELSAENIKYELYTFDNGNSLIKEYDNGRSFQLVVLDMVMEPINGIDTAKEIRKHDLSVPILIVTSTTEYALEGYSVDARRYLTKPLDKERFLSEVRQVYEMVSADDDKCFVIRNEDGVTKIRINDILYFESNRHTITAHTLKQNYSFRDTINNVESKYSSFGFFRIHKSFLVNLRYVTNVSKQLVTLVNGEKVDVSKTHITELHEALLDYASQSVSEIL